eukprot:30914-Pelagococcus_subviridis.AAC.8
MTRSLSVKTPNSSGGGPSMLRRRPTLAPLSISDSASTRETSARYASRRRRRDCSSSVAVDAVARVPRSIGHASARTAGSTPPFMTLARSSEAAASLTRPSLSCAACQSSRETARPRRGCAK